MALLKALFGGGVPHLSAQEYREEFSKQPHTLIDVRTRAEYKEGHLPKSVNIPLDQLDKKLKRIPTGKPVVLVCRSGNRSLSAAMRLKREGREDVYNLRGGTLSWARSGGKLKK